MRRFNLKLIISAHSLLKINKRYPRPCCKFIRCRDNQNPPNSISAPRKNLKEASVPSAEEESFFFALQIIIYTRKIDSFLHRWRCNLYAVWSRDKIVSRIKTGDRLIKIKHLTDERSVAIKSYRKFVAKRARTN